MIKLIIETILLGIFIFSTLSSLFQVMYNIKEDKNTLMIIAIVPVLSFMSFWILFNN